MLTKDEIEDIQSTLKYINEQDQILEDKLDELRSQYYVDTKTAKDKIRGFYNTYYDIVKKIVISKIENDYSIEWVEVIENGFEFHLFNNEKYEEKTIIISFEEL